MTEETKKKIEDYRESKKNADLKDATPNNEELELITSIMEEAKMPTVLKDGDVVCGPGELDIRELNAKNRAQMEYRAKMLQVVYLRRLNEAVTDLSRLCIVALRKLGVTDIAKEIEEAIEALRTEAAR